ncbi:MAG: EFR1 family ferrodoxin [Eubacteriales bacterium]
MKATIFFFSGTGNTYLAATNIAKHLNEMGAEAQAVSIESAEAKDIKKLQAMVETSDKIAVGYPIYGSKAPKIMEQFMDNFPETKDKKPVSLFTTVALYSGDGAVFYSKKFIEKGYVFENGVEFVSNNNFNVPGFPDVLKVGDEKKVSRKNEKLIAKTKTMAEAMIKGKPMVQGRGVFARWIGGMQRKYVDEWIVKINGMLYVEHSKCINCGRCVKICPVENISTVDGKITFADGCIACMRCYHFCPTAAINITEKSIDTDKWPRYKGPNKEYIKTLL